VHTIEKSLERSVKSELTKRSWHCCAQQDGG